MVGPAMTMNAELSAIGIDTGGTFTDLVAWIDGRLVVRKVLSSPADPAAAVLTVLGELGASGAAVVHGTTVATNALLERRGARVALLTTAGCEDLIEIGRQARPDPYALEPRRSPPLVPRELRFGVRGPLAPGSAIAPPTAAELEQLRENLGVADVEAVAICLLFSYADGEVEDCIAAALAGGPWEVSRSSQVLPVFREYERTSTTVANAYVAPRMSGYLRGLAGRAAGLRWSVMASNAGSLDLETAAALPAACLLSGPAGGVLGAARVAAGLGLGSFMTLDMGGTSTDVCLVEGEIPTSDESVISGLPIAFPAVDIHTVGAGGGSVVRLDRAGVLRVGPESAGAEPGPIAYGRGTRPTVTDANLLLGRIPADTFALLGELAGLDGDVPPVMERVRGAFAGLGAALGVSAEEAAGAALAAVEASMARALRVISTRRGRDPRGSTLICFGGAGPLHGVALAAALGMERVVVPPYPGVLSACGLAGADGRRDYVQAVLQPLDARLDRPAIAALLGPLVERAQADARSSGQPEPRLIASLDLRYRGQSHEIEVRFGDDDYVECFHVEHERRFGHADRRRGLDLVHARVRAVVPGRELRLEVPEVEAVAGSAAVAGRRSGDERQSGDRRQLCIDRATLRSGDLISGPAVLTEATATTWLPGDWAARVAPCGSLVLSRRAEWDERGGGGDR